MATSPVRTNGCLGLSLPIVRRRRCAICAISHPKEQRPEKVRIVDLRFKPPKFCQSILFCHGDAPLSCDTAIIEHVFYSCNTPTIKYGIFYNTVLTEG